MALLAAHDKHRESVTKPSFRRIFLTRRLYPRQNSSAEQHDRAHDNPVRGHMHQVRTVDQSNDHDCEPYRVQAERHVHLLFEVICFEVIRD